MNKTLTLLAVVLATAATTFAGDVSKKVVVSPQSQDLFRAGAVSYTHLTLPTILRV